MKAFISTTSFLKPQNAAAKALAESFFDEVTYNELGVPLKGDEILSVWRAATRISRASTISQRTSSRKCRRASR